MSTASVRAVSMMTGVLDVARIARHSEKPSMNGIITSRSTTSGCSAWNAARPASPSGALVTVKP